MKIAVFLKQVPDNEESNHYQDVEYMNQSDKNVLMEALHLRDQKIRDGEPSSVIVMVLGPDRAVNVLKEAQTFGVDETVLVQDPAFHGADVEMAAVIMAEALRLQKADLILCGRQAIDGDAAHMAVMTAERLQVPQVLYAKNIQMEADCVKVIRFSDYGDYEVECQLPLLVMSMKEKYEPRHPKMSDIMKAYSPDVKITYFGAGELSVLPEELGMKALKVKLHHDFWPEEKEERQLIWLTGSTEEEKAASLAEKLRELRFI